MAYELHITREEFWVDDVDPVTFEEISALDLPAGFAVEEDYTAVAKTPFGEMRSSLGECVIYTKADGGKVIMHFMGETPSFRAVSKDDIIPFVGLAKLLGAKVQGDDGEEYAEDGSCR
ncbi:hypothetical protein [Ruminococcus sp.]|uniref:hypothetical protein n=1 Tax=Ruminococcus sp. TaxID=41978 RepID=UPI0025FBF4C2|nr:hypothetical protein [Ruminococcus sp.]MBQ8966976.1 hypothetical protein [Ruminococcus sp.]